MRYKIGEVQKILGISPETLRYFEKMKIIESKRNEQNQYRYYEAEDINKIFVYKMYRSMEFTMEEASTLVSGKSIAYLQEKMLEHKEQLEERKNMIDAIISNLTYSCNILKKFDQEDRPFELGNTEDMYFFENQEEDRFVISEEKSEMASRCFEHLYTCVPTFRCTYHEYGSIVYGYGIKSQNIPTDLENMGTRIGNKRCFHGVVKIKNREEIYQPIFDKIKEAEEIYHMKCSSQIYGRVHHEEKENGNIFWYQEIWAVIKEE